MSTSLPVGRRVALLIAALSIAFAPAIAMSPAAEAATPTRASEHALFLPRPAQTWGACSYLSDATKTVAYYKLRGTTSIRLTCGTSGYGYRHIQAKHASQFETVAFGTQFQGNWRYMADFAIGQVLSSPSTSVYQGSNKYCYSRKLPIVDLRTGEVTKHQIFKVVVDIYGRKIITAYPSRSHC